MVNIEDRSLKEIRPRMSRSATIALLKEVAAKRGKLLTIATMVAILLGVVTFSLVTVLSLEAPKIFANEASDGNNNTARIVIEESNYQDQTSASRWALAQPAVGYEAHDVTFAVKQNNLDKVKERLLAASAPGSTVPYFTRAEVHNLTKNVVGTRTVLRWLRSEGVAIRSVLGHGAYIRARANTSTWSRLFQTSFAHLSLAGDELTQVLRAIEPVSIDAELSPHVVGILQTTQLPPITAKPRPSGARSHMSSDVTSARMFAEYWYTYDEDHSPPPSPYGGFDQPPPSPPLQLITPAHLRSFYHIPEVGSIGIAQAGAVTQAVYESLGQAFSPQDLTTFQNQFGLPVQGVSTFIGDGVHSNGACSTESNCGEANLDVQYLMAVAPNTPTTYWYSSEGTSYDDWITSVAQAESIPDVISISYGAIESELGSSTLNAFNTEALKLGAQGVTIVVSSGDDGVANFIARPSREGKGGCGYNPSFPASSPYVLAVGATQGAEKGGPEIVCDSQTGASITSGGGFSAVFDQPSYQSTAVSSYLAQVSGTAREPQSGYAATGRAYPDVAMAGHSYVIVDGGQAIVEDGTSCAAPVVAGMISSVNAERKAAGKGPVGFVNPKLYANGTGQPGSCCNDITSGNNMATSSTSVVCSEGFYAASGWDPTTGLGSVDYEKLKALLM